MLKCFSCPKIYDENTPRYKCDCGGFLYHEFERTPRLEPKELANRSQWWWRYREALPLHRDENIVTLNERPTSLRSVRLGGEQVQVKLDGECPTGSFKDRGSFLMVSKLKEWGLKDIIEDSSGNAGASIAAYSQVAGIRAKIFAPAYTSPAKLRNIAQYGAQLVTIEGSREDTAQAALNEAERTFYASHNWSPYFAAGVKTLAYELWEQLGFKAPDAVIVPVGGGSSLLGLYYGFMELAHTGRIDKLPRLIAVQSSACAPLYQAFVAGSTEVTEVTKSSTIAEGIVIAKPVKGSAMLKALRDTTGTCLTVSDEEVLTALTELTSQGVLVEPTSGVGAAGFIKAVATGAVSSGERVVIELTGIKKG